MTEVREGGNCLERDVCARAVYVNIPVLFCFVFLLYYWVAEIDCYSLVLWCNSSQQLGPWQLIALSLPFPSEMGERIKREGR